MFSKINGLVRIVAVIGALMLSALIAPLANAQSCGTLPCAFEAASTPLVSTTSSMISYRDEQHAWQTPDNLTHYLINVGTAGGQQGLQIWTRYVDPGTAAVTWVAGPFIPNSGANSTADGRLVTNSGTTSLSVVYSTTITGNNSLNGGNIAYMLLDYNVTPTSTTSGWTLDFTVSHSTQLTNIFTAPNGYYALNPTLAIDTTSAATNWVAYTLTQCQNNICPATSTIKLSYLGKVNNSSNWVDSGLTFGPTDGNFTSVERSARLVATANAVGMIYQVHQSFFWTYRINGSQAGSAWSAPVPFFTSAPIEGATDPGSLYDNNPYASHYNVVPDTDNPAYIPGGTEAKVHMVTVDHQRLLYFGYGENQSGGWSNPMEVGTPAETLGASYPQIFFAPAMNSSSSKYLGALVNNSSNGVLFQSTDNGQSFQLGANLNHDSIPSGTVTFVNPRFEVPTAVTSNDVPIVQQYADQSGPNSYLMFFDLSGLIN